MNERITLLALKASDPKTGWLDRQKFAELIIQECVDLALAKKKWVEDQTAFDPRDQAWNRARIQQSQYIVDKIKEHFGVEP